MEVSALFMSRLDTGSLKQSALFYNMMHLIVLRVVLFHFISYNLILSQVTLLVLPWIISTTIMTGNQFPICHSWLIILIYDIVSL